MDSLLERGLLTTFRWQSRHAMRISEVDQRQPPSPPRGPVSLYVHVPFCTALCPFCTFHRVPYRERRANTYFAALRDELRLYHRAGFAFASLYVGGGTPTCAPGELVETIGLARDLFGMTEVSVETNPRDLRPDVLTALAGVGVRRLSVGVQSFDDRLLRAMDRYDHYGSSAEIIDRVNVAAGSFTTLNVDLMYNLPNQDLASLEHDLDVVLGLASNQVSFYPLMTARASAAKIRSTMGSAGPSRVHEFYGRFLARLRPAYGPQSCWCFSRTPSAIDEYVVDAEHYVGIGSGAFSYLDGTLYAATFSLNHYTDRVSRGLTGITGRRVFSVEDQLKNAFLSGLFGLELPKSRVRARWGDRFEAQLRWALDAMRAIGALTEDADAWRLTDRGMYLWVLMMSEFYESVNRFRDAMRAGIRDELEAS
jgi:coproporphyrinogen III oxidase-like Fe-S oxidoreductase